MTAEMFFNAARVLSKRFTATFLGNGVNPTAKPAPKTKISLGLLSMNVFGNFTSRNQAEREQDDLQHICVEREQLLVNQLETLSKLITSTSVAYRKNIEKQVFLLEKGKTGALTHKEENELKNLREENKLLKKELQRCKLLTENMPNTVFCQGMSSIYCQTGNPDELCLYAYYKFEMEVYNETKMNEEAEYKLYMATGTALPADWGKPKKPAIPLRFVFPN